MNDAPSIGHNLDPLVQEIEAQADIVNRWLAAHGDLDQWDNATAVRCVSLIDDVGKAWSALDGRRLNEKRDFLKAEAEKYTAPLELGLAAKRTLDRLRKGWLQREDDRVRREAAAAAERAKKLADEAAKVLAKAQANKKDPLGAQMAAQEAEQRARDAQAEAEAAPVKAQIRGAGIHTKSLRTLWSAKITDPKLAWKSYKSHPLMVQAIKDTMLKIAINDARACKDASLAPQGVEYYSFKE